MNKIPAGVQNHIFRFLTHPAADAIRERISEFQAFSSQHESTSHLNTFYIFFFLDKKIRDTIAIIDDMYERLGVRVGVDDSYFRPSLWRLYENQFLGYFSCKFYTNTNPIYRTTI